MLRRRPGSYAARFGIAVGALAGAGTVFVLLGDSWWQILLAAFLGVVFTQIAFLAHDVGHRQVFTTKRAAQVAGMALGNLAVGLSYGWWIGKHTRHHANPNHVDEDPDVGVGVIAWSPEQAREKRAPASRLLAAWQAFLFFALLLLEGLQLHVQSVRALWEPEVKHKRLEALLLAVHTVGYLTALFVVVSPGKALVFIAVHEAVFGLYMGSSFAPNHKGMPIVVAFCREHRIAYHGSGLIRSYHEVLSYSTRSARYVGHPDPSPRQPSRTKHSTARACAGLDPR